MVGLLNLHSLGWSSYFSDQIISDENSMQPARVIAIHKGECDVSDGSIIRPSKMTGRLRHQAKSKIDYPTVGDWVLVKSFNKGEFGSIHRVLNRSSALIRKSSGRSINKQLIAANIDVAFIVQSLGPMFNFNRLERYLVMVNESNIKPVIILTKTDLLNPEEVEQKRNEVTCRIPEVKIVMLSNRTKQGINFVQDLFKKRLTYCVVGLSGVGKTTLLNELLGRDLLPTLPVRETDGKGLHTTTRRELITLENGSHIIDTPGMRELGNLDANSGIKETYNDINNTAESCLYNDCDHLKSEGCAVIKSLESGDLSKERYEHYLKLIKESYVSSNRKSERIEKEKKNSRFHGSENK